MGTDWQRETAKEILDRDPNLPHVFTWADVRRFMVEAMYSQQAQDKSDRDSLRSEVEDARKAANLALVRASEAEAERSRLREKVKQIDKRGDWYKQKWRESKEQAEARLAVLRQVEWNTYPSDEACPICHGEPAPRGKGHADDCALAAVLPDDEPTAWQGTGWADEVPRRGETT